MTCGDCWRLWLIVVVSLLLQMFCKLNFRHRCEQLQRKITVYIGLDVNPGLWYPLRVSEHVPYKQGISAAQIGKQFALGHLLGISNKMHSQLKP